MSDWHALAACRDYEPDEWFPRHAADAGPAILICQGCPARRACAREALDTKERHGVRAGVLLVEESIRECRDQLRAVAG